MRDKLIGLLILLLLGVIVYLSEAQWAPFVKDGWGWLSGYGDEVGLLDSLFAIIGTIIALIMGYFALFGRSNGENEAGGESNGDGVPANTPPVTVNLQLDGLVDEVTSRVSQAAALDLDLDLDHKKKNQSKNQNQVSPLSSLSSEEVARARARYLNLLAQRCNVLPLAALGGQEGMGEEVKLDEVYVALDTTSRVPLTEEEEKKQDGYKYSLRDDRVLTALEVATQQRRLVLLGDPGSGKSTFVRQLVAGAARACESFDTSASSVHRKLKNQAQPFRDGWQVGLLPLFVVLRDLVPRLEALRLDGSTEEKREGLLEALWAQWREDLSSLGAQGFEEGVREALEDGSVLLVFDGLDEVASAWRERVRLAVDALIQSYPQIRRVIVTCRIRSYEGNAQLPTFTQHTLAPFTEAQIEDFIGLWYRAQAGLGRMDQATAQERTNDLQRAALAAGLRELAENPMLLTTITLIHQQQVGLPHERVRLYARAVEVLMVRWQKHKKNQSAALEGLLHNKRRLRLIMERLAYEAHQTQSQPDGAGDLPRRELLYLLEDPAYLGEVSLVGEFLDYVDQRAGLLIGRGGHEKGGKPPLYTFPHRTFQEYLAGCYMARGRHREVLVKYTTRLTEGDYWQLAAQLGGEELFYERAGEKEVLDLAYDLCPPEAPSTLADWRGVLWSGLMAALLGVEEVRQDAAQPGGDRRYLPRLLKRLVELMQNDHLPPIERAEAGRVLAQLGDPRPEVLTVDEMKFCHVPAGAFWMGAPDDAQPARRNERPGHKINLSYDYCISRHPITNAQFEQFLKAGGYQKEEFWTPAKAHGVWKDGKVKPLATSEPRDRPRDFGSPFNLPNHPVVGITFYEALAFACWLSKRWGCVVALPTEVEWEKAARGGEMIPEKPLICTASQLNDPAFLASLPAPTLKPNPFPQRHFPWGNQADPTRANSEETGIRSTNAVGCFAKGESPYGAQEMSGNVWEWVESLNHNYPYRPEYQRETLQLSSKHERIIIRSGSFYEHILCTLCFFRLWIVPIDRTYGWGFRVFRPYKL